MRPKFIFNNGYCVQFCVTNLSNDDYEVTEKIYWVDVKKKLELLSLGSKL
jgi:hypothetical protein